MKKVAAAISGVFIAFAPSFGQSAEKVKLELGGFSNWFVVGSWNNRAYQSARGVTYNNVDVKGQSNLIFSGSTTLDNGLDVGVYTALVAGTDTGVGGANQNNFVDRAYLYVASAYGKAILGVLQNGAHLLYVQAPDAIGQWNNDGLLTHNFVIARPQNVIGVNGNTINSTSLLVGNGSAKNETLTYITPGVYGFTLAGSYTPNSAKNVRGPVALQSTVHDLYTIGGNYTNSVSGFDVKAAVGWQCAAFGPSAIANPYQGRATQILNAYNVGLNLSYAGFTLGGSFRWNQHREKDGGLGGASLDGTAWDGGLRYAEGPWAASFVAYGSNIKGQSYNAGNAQGGKDETVNFYQASARYALGPGVNLQGMMGYGSYKTSTATASVQRGPSFGNENRGWMAMSGLSLTF